MATTDEYRLSDRYTAQTGEVFMTGIQALARVPIEQLLADRRAKHNTAAFVSGYPGSPLGGFDTAVAQAAKLAPDLPIIHRPGLNEEYAATSVMGSQLVTSQPDSTYDGVIGIWYGKAPGVDRASDAIRHGVFAGTSRLGGALAYVGDDPAAKSSTVPSSSAASLADMHIPVLYPSDPAEALDLGRHGIALSRSTGLWVGLKIVADVADGTATVSLDPDRVQPIIPLLDGKPYVNHPDGRLLAADAVVIEQEIYDVRYNLAIQYASDNDLNHVTVNPPDAWIGLISSGITYREVREALTGLGLADDAAIHNAGIRLLHLQMPMPFNPATIREFSQGLDEIFVIEEKAPNVESLVKDALYSLAQRPIIVGKTDEQDAALLPGHGALHADNLRPALRRRLASRIGDRLAPEVIPREKLMIPLTVERSPFFCSGCPHNRSTEVPDGALIGAGIGCHTMVLLMDEDRVGDIVGLTAMGNEGTQWIGMEPFIERKHFIQNLGDGTFFHSGQLAIRAAVAAGVSITYKLLYNDAVAMTGGQDAQGAVPVPQVVVGLQACGVAEVLITTDDVDKYRGVELPANVEVWDRTRIIEAQERLAQVSGVTVLIHDQACAAEARRERKRGLIPTPTQRVVINHRICEGCGDCGEVSNCLSVQPLQTPYGRKTTIDQTTCNLDYSCLEGDCPSFMTIDVSEPGVARRALSRLGLGRKSEPTPKPSKRPAPTVDLSKLPQPVLAVPTDDYSVRITGIGGTGVVTIAQTLGTAAMLDGYEVRGLDQIGLSQKAGPVVSDVRLRRDAPADTSRVGDEQADLLLALDQLVAASDKGLSTASPTITTVVGSTTSTPTGSMITHPDTVMPSPDELAASIEAVSRPGYQYWADASAITRALFGHTVYANVFVVGMAVQTGCLPITAASIERALALNGVDAENNIAAFRCGRQYAVDPSGLDLGSDRQLILGASGVGLSADGALDELIRHRSADLIEYQDRDYAERFEQDVAAARAAELRLGLTERHYSTAVATYLHKLMAYKDEYEVARLMTDPDGLAVAETVARPGSKMAWRLHPPMLRALGMDNKISIGAWAEPGIKVLAKGKRLRGSALDPFGRAEVRKVERALIDEYREAIAETNSTLAVENYERAVKLAELPDMVRGYEDLKLRRAQAFREALASARRELG